MYAVRVVPRYYAPTCGAARLRRLGRGGGRHPAPRHPLRTGPARSALERAPLTRRHARLGEKKKKKTMTTAWRGSLRSGEIGEVLLAEGDPGDGHVVLQVRQRARARNGQGHLPSIRTTSGPPLPDLPNGVQPVARFADHPHVVVRRPCAVPRSSHSSSVGSVIVAVEGQTFAHSGRPRCPGAVGKPVTASEGVYAKRTWAAAMVPACMRTFVRHSCTTRSRRAGPRH